METVPATTPETTPVPETTDANAGMLLLHVPPPASLNVVVEPIQSDLVKSPLFMLISLLFLITA